MLTKAFKVKVKPGRQCRISGEAKCNLGDYPGANKLGAVVTWTPGKRSLRVKADVVDRHYSTDAPENSPQDASCIELYVCPSGTYRDLNEFTIVPGGAGGKARVIARRDPNDIYGEVKSPASLGVKATWKRTPRGYRIDATIPWNAIKGYERNWTLMPVDAAIYSQVDGEQVQMTMGAPGDPATEFFTYPALTAR
ncbi:MAG: hypothetical protein M1133_10765 [Armatimonadetes bacterium]|nr:hypothetical protein [Armatimonadota bacterium]